MRVDAHHHLWRYNDQEFAWISDAAATLRRDFLPEALHEVLQEAGVEAAVAVQARCCLEETDWLVDCARRSPLIRKVVGWVPLTAHALPALVERFAAEPRIAGFREIVQEQPAGYLLAEPFNRGMQELTAHDLTYDLLLRADQLPEATRFVDRHPNQRFVLDHAGKPPIRAGQLEPWRTALHALGTRQNVLCKLSGLVTEADWQRWTESDLKPYLDTCVEAFGPERCMAGSDWPVCLTASTYSRWWGVLEAWAATYSEAEQQAILGGTAARFYGFAPDMAEAGGDL